MTKTESPSSVWGSHHERLFVGCVCVGLGFKQYNPRNSFELLSAQSNWRRSTICVEQRTTHNPTFPHKPILNIRSHMHIFLFSTRLLLGAHFCCSMWIWSSSSSPQGSHPPKPNPCGWWCFFKRYTWCGPRTDTPRPTVDTYIISRASSKPRITYSCGATNEYRTQTRMRQTRHIVGAIAIGLGRDRGALPGSRLCAYACVCACVCVCVLL